MGRIRQQQKIFIIQWKWSIWLGFQICSYLFCDDKHKGKWGMTMKICFVLNWFFETNMTLNRKTRAKNFDFHTVEVLLLFCFFVFVRINETTRELKWSSINKSIWTQLIAYLLTDAEPWLRISRKTAMCRRNEIHNQHALSVWQPENYVRVMVLLLYKRRELPNKRASVKCCVTGIR